MPNRGKVPVLVTYLTLGFSLSDKHFCLGLNRTAGGVTLSADYDKAFPPLPHPVEVSLKVYVQTVAPILTSELEFRVNMRWTLTWVDPRVSLVDPDPDPDDVDPVDPDACTNTSSSTSYVIAPPGFASQIWIPDPYLVNSKFTGIKGFNGKLANLVIFANHTLAYTMILNATVACDMDFEFYPLDVQYCPILVQSCEH
ncbi:gamma-aminobutyric acid receptor subunit beta-like [Folsomia candida]|uniref:gamma-aminobutyric acid receptor subunit beta-like n=1 Tax=Folsomia candida TaxID=158441 RepID=UPI000B90818B|nr:gamma-aminobutyric acid receptor subunit beta-like [Folsomia candida]